LGLAEVAGTWEGALKYPAQTLRIVLHISGDDNHLAATNDSPDQGIWGPKVDSITLSDHVLTFGIHLIDGAFSGNLVSDGGWSAAAGRVAIPLVETEGNIWMIAPPGLR
jgi:hypothetical protein